MPSSNLFPDSTSGINFLMQIALCNLSQKFFKAEFRLCYRSDDNLPLL